MSVIALDRVPTDRAEPSALAVVPSRGFWRRVFDRLVEARQRKATEELRRYHRHLLPRELEDAGCKIDARSEDSLPFVR